ncbi:hypothetical protein ACUXFG_001783 [Staphylococcus capitis]|nr:Uncharacterised protein [Staphylococcus capitis]
MIYTLPWSIADQGFIFEKYNQTLQLITEY